MYLRWLFDFLEKANLDGMLELLGETTCHVFYFFLCPRKSWRQCDVFCFLVNR